MVNFTFSCSSAKPLENPPENDAEEENEEDESDIVLNLLPEGVELPVSAFPEIWAYVVAGREEALRPGMPITDIGYCFADVDSYGKLADLPNRKKLEAFPGRVHLVVKCDGYGLSHFVLLPDRPEREALVADLIKATRDYDGLQIDFEYILQRDGPLLVSFLAELRKGLGVKMLTVAVPAKTQSSQRVNFDYEKIQPLVDKILVMAYDEHWSGSKPGSIASLGWCRRVAEYCIKTIEPGKLIMGLPFYGRAWGNPSPSRALVYSAVETLIKEHNVSDIRRENGIPTFKYEVPVTATVYFEDAYSLSARMEMYKSMGIGAIGFWRLGQETPAVWQVLALEK